MKDLPEVKVRLKSRFWESVLDNLRSKIQDAGLSDRWSAENRPNIKITENQYGVVLKPKQVLVPSQVYSVLVMIREGGRLLLGVLMTQRDNDFQGPLTYIR